MALVAGTNSYVSIDAAGLYFEDSVNESEWIAFGEAAQEKALVSATRLLDNEEWVGYIASNAQSLMFPRVGDYFDPSSGQLIIMDGSEIPNRIVVATYELALHILQNPEVFSASAKIDEFEISGISMKGVGNVPTYPNHVYRLISPLLSNSNRSWWRAW